MPPGGRPAVGLSTCLAAVSAGPVQTLIVPADGLVPGYECGRCGTLSLVADSCCPDWGTAALPVPDLIEEMVSRVLEDGGDVFGGRRRLVSALRPPTLTHRTIHLSHPVGPHSHLLESDSLRISRCTLP